jgi:hypothetical protein
LSERRTYRFGPVERRGFLGPVRGGQVAVVGVGVVVALVVLGSSSSPSRGVGAVALLGVSIVVATAKIGGRTVEQWLPVAGGWLLRHTLGAHEFRSSAPTMGHASRTIRPVPTRELDMAAPPALAGVEIFSLRYRGRTVGALSERGGRWMTAVLACRVMAFSLLDLPSQERALSHWGNVLSGCADTPVRRIQWVERTAPVEVDALGRWLQTEHDPEVAVRDAPIVESYLELLDQGVGVSQQHEILIALQVDAHRVRGRGRDAVGETLLEETERIADGLRRAGISVQGGLTAAHLALLLRTAFDPYVRRDAATMLDPERTDDPHAWPVGTSEAWSHYRTDGAVHSTYWIAGWPRLDVGAVFLDPLLSESSVVRTVAVTFEPVSADRSIREVEAQVTRDQADHALRARFGQAETARQHQAYTATRRREAELAAGFGEVRFVGFVTVTGPELNALETARTQVRRDAVRSRLDLRPMSGQQADAFTFTLPLCRGLR